MAAWINSWIDLAFFKTHRQSPFSNLKWNNELKSIQDSILISMNQFTICLFNNFMYLFIFQFNSQINSGLNFFLFELIHESIPSRTFSTLGSWPNRFKINFLVFLYKRINLVCNFGIMNRFMNQFRVPLYIVFHSFRAHFSHFLETSNHFLSNHSNPHPFKPQKLLS